MRFRQHQDDARRATRRLLLLFLVTVAGTVACANGALALIWRLQSGGAWGYPPWFFETNTLVALGFILGGSWLETQRLRQGGAHVAQLLGGRELREPRSMAERRLRNVVDEVAIAAGLKAPRVFLLDRDDAINAFAAGWEQQDSVVAVTRGALERLSRDELQGVVAHEFGHILHGDTRLNMRLIGYVFGLQMIFNFGRSMTLPTDEHGRRGAALLAGLALMAAGFLGWMAGRLLQAAVSRQREYLADAHAVQFTRLPEGIGGALRKIAHQMAHGEARLHSANADVVSHLLLSAGASARARWLATHPPVAERLRRIYGRVMAPVEAPVIEPVEAPGRGPFEMPAFELPAFVPTHGGGPMAGLAPAGPLAKKADRAPGTAGDAVSPAAHAGHTGQLAQAEKTEPSEHAEQARRAEQAEQAKQAKQAEQAEQAEQTLQGLREFTPANLLQAAALAFLVPARVCPEHEVWHRFAAGISGAQAVLEAVWRVPARRRQPWFERLLVQAAALSPTEQRVLRQQALQIVSADGRLVLHELLAAMQIHHDLALRHERLAVEPRHLPMADRVAEIALVTQALGSLLAQGQPAGWSRQVMGSLALPDPAPSAEPPPPARVRQAILRLRDLAMTQTPLLAKQWVANQPVQPMAQPMADALRAVCLLIDTPMPPALVDRFDTLDQNFPMAVSAAGP